jgi:hypothetical protein
MEHRQFVIVDVATPADPSPYAQAAPEPAGDWYCEVVSASYLPDAVWPIREDSLLLLGWQAPDDRSANWSREAVDAQQAAEFLVDGLRLGRSCGDPGRYSWDIGRFPPPPDGGEPEPSWPRGPFGLAA